MRFFLRLFLFITEAEPRVTGQDGATGQGGGDCRVS